MSRTRMFAAICQLVALAASLATLSLPAFGQDRPGAAPPVVVFAAASLKTALDAVAADWKKESGDSTTISYAASSTLARQIEAGAPADIFISADEDWMDWAQQRKLINTASRETLLGNALVLIAGRDANINFKIAPAPPAPGANLAAALGNGRLAVGEVNSVPAGKYAKEALEKLNLWSEVADRLAPALDVRAALNLVARGEAPLGIVYATDARAEPRVKVVDTFPASSHAPILYPAAVTATSHNPDAAAFLRYLRSAAAVHDFTDQGFVMAGK